MGGPFVFLTQSGVTMGDVTYEDLIEMARIIDSVPTNSRFIEMPK